MTVLSALCTEDDGTFKVAVFPSLLYRGMRLCLFMVIFLYRVVLLTCYQLALLAATNFCNCLFLVLLTFPHFLYFCASFFLKWAIAVTLKISEDFTVNSGYIFSYLRFANNCTNSFILIFILHHGPSSWGIWVYFGFKNSIFFLLTLLNVWSFSKSDKSCDCTISQNNYDFENHMIRIFFWTQ